MKRRRFIQISFATTLLLAGCQDPNSGQTSADDNQASRGAKQNPDSKPEERPETQEETQMYGIIGKMNATEGNRDRLIKILLDGTKEMPGCKLYAISTDSADENGIWITEIWDSEESHQASLVG